MDELDARLAADLASGKLTEIDVCAVQTYRLFLRECRKGWQRDATCRRRWLAYACGLTDGPTTTAQYAALLPRLWAMQRERRAATEAREEAP